MVLEKSKKTATTIVIISKTGVLSEVVVAPESETTLEELTILLSKKCGYRNHTNFSCYHTYKYKNKKKFAFNIANEDVTPKYIYVDIWAKTEGQAGNENKYEMPPPIDEIIFYGNMALVARVDMEHAVNLTISIWNVIYERLFGGFEDLASTAIEDENEIDELDMVPASKKTVNGYLKDGFVVDDDSDDKCCKRQSKKNGGKKNKSESTESEFITETDTESGTPPSDSLTESDGEGEGEGEGVGEGDADTEFTTSASKKNRIKTPAKPLKKPMTTIKKTTTASASAVSATTKSKKNKKEVEEPPVEQESEKELSEEEYL